MRAPAPDQTPPIRAPKQGETAWLLVQIRWVGIISLIVALVYALKILRLDLPYEPIGVVTVLLVFYNLLTAVSVTRRTVLPDWVILAQLALDTGALTALLALSGGAASPFTMLLMVPPLLAVSLCTPFYALPIYLLSNLAMFGLVALTAEAGPAPTGLFLAFVLTSTLMVWFVLRLRLSMAARERAIEELRRAKAEADQLVGLGLLASGMAHELGTPLTTLAVTLDDWAEIGPPEGDALAPELDRMITQLRRCRAIVSRTLQAAGRERLEAAADVPAEAEIRRILAIWSGSRGRARVPVQTTPALRGTRILTAPIFEAALVNLLDNAESVAPGTLEASLNREGNLLVFTLTDRGPGFPESVLANPGAPFLSGSGQPGRGLGLFLARNAIDRLGGRMELRNTPTGAEVRLSLPLLSRSLPEEIRHE
ncbi:two-component system sensor histidine kinase RegB [Rhodobacter sp. JA431]|uniref:ATP-binding protein n=1 Tax=Rhodobacter sp. JA431 TaxID=570013 RepID=UPI000BCFB7FE|nr:ATP-binding protein [Rhodobacter sp. JA431]SOC12776.1 two-component system sensor histidine kinase RegB [Rhodobacter sp. JA431]